VEPFHFYKMQSDKLKSQRSRLFCTFLNDTNIPVPHKTKRHITTAREAREQLTMINEKLENPNKNIADLPNIGLGLVKTTFKIPLIQEYYNQLVEDIKTRLFSTYEASEYKGCLFLIRNATSLNIKVAVTQIFRKYIKSPKRIKKNISELQYKFSAFSILRDRSWLQEQLFMMLNPQVTSDIFYEEFIYELGNKMEVPENEHFGLTSQYIKSHNFRSLSPPGNSSSRLIPSK